MSPPGIVSKLSISMMMMVIVAPFQGPLDERFISYPHVKYTVKKVLVALDAHPDVAGSMSRTICISIHQGNPYIAGLFSSYIWNFFVVFCLILPLDKAQKII